VTEVARLLHLVGSPTDDFHAELSRLYARDCLEALRATTDHEHLIAHVEPGGWRFPSDLDDATLAAAPLVDTAAAVARLLEVGADAVLPQLFCRAGMTHHRALLDVLGLPYVGNDPATMALGADKARARAVVAAAGVAVPEGVVVRAGQPCPLPLPVVVKPVDADNSAGVTLVRPDDASDRFDAAVSTACAEDGGGRALVETYVPLGRELRCGVVEVDGRPVPLPPEEYAVDEQAKPVRDAADKLSRDEAGSLGLVAKDAEHAWLVDADDPVVPALHAAALTAYDALGCRHYGLFDFRVDPEGRVFFLEAGLYCSYAPSSVVVTMARAAGVDLPGLLAAGLAALDPPSSPTGGAPCT